MSITEKLVAIQSELKAPKDQKAQKYRYRNIEDVNEAVKPLAAAQGCAVVYTDRYENGACVSTCTLTDGSESASAEGFAIVNAKPANMSVEQACGAASSYARKYAACGLFAIDDSKLDPDRTADKAPESRSKAASPANPAEDAYQSARRRLANVCGRYASAMGVDAKTIMDGVMQRSDYAANAKNPAWLGMVADEFEAAL